MKNRLKRKNNLVNQDANLVFPLNQLINGSAIKAEAPISFKDGIGKFNPLLCIQKGLRAE